MYYYFIVNPNSGSGKGLKVWNRVRAYMDKTHLDFDAFMTTARGDALLKAKDICRELPEDAMLVTIGGDGTMNEVINGAPLEKRMRLCYIPAGTGNDLDRGLKLSRRFKIPQRILSEAVLSDIDYGVITLGSGTVRRFAVSTGAGFDAAVCEDLMEVQTRHAIGRTPLRKTAYLGKGLRNFIGIHPTRGFIVLDNEKRVEFSNLLFLSLLIHPFEGGGYKFAPHADCRDGLLDVCVVSCKDKLEVAAPLLFSKNGIKNGKGIRTFTCREAHIELETPFPVHTDGEVLGYETEIDVCCFKRKLSILL